MRTNNTNVRENKSKNNPKIKSHLINHAFIRKIKRKEVTCMYLGMWPLDQEYQIRPKNYS